MLQYNFSEKQLKDIISSTLDAMKEEIFARISEKLLSLDSDNPSSEPKEKNKHKKEKTKKDTKSKKAPATATTKTKDSNFVEAAKKALLTPGARAYKTQAYYNVNTGRVNTKSAAMIKKYVFYSLDDMFICGDQNTNKLEEALGQFSKEGIELEEEEGVATKRVVAPKTKDPKKGTGKGSKKEKTKKKLPEPKQITVTTDADGMVRDKHGFVIDPESRVILGADPDKTGKVRKLTKKEEAIAKKNGYELPRDDLDDDDKQDLLRASRRTPGENIVLEDGENSDTEDIFSDMAEKRDLNDELEQNEDEEEKEEFLHFMRVLAESKTTISMCRANLGAMSKSSGLDNSRLKEFTGEENYENLKKKYGPEITEMALEFNIDGRKKKASK